ncbi:MAG: leucine-rich repeat protein [Lachnospiraceae bacterium]|nr:leucine-rich repeat protein [Lachnospiraceae bacterium]
MTAIGENACKDQKKLEKVTISKYVTQIGKGAFSGCNALKKVTIKGSGLTEVGKKAFSQTAKKASFNVPNKLADKYKKMLIDSGADSGIKCK